MKDDIIIRTRAEWGAVTVSESFSRDTALGIVLHNMQNANREPLADPNAEQEFAFGISRECQRMHMEDNGWSDTGQNFTISRGGVIMEGRKSSIDAAHHGTVTQGAHASGVPHFNRHFHGIELEGDFRESFAIAPEQLTALVNLCAHLRIWAGNPEETDWKVIPHAQVLEGHTDCPGLLIDHMDEVRVAIRGRINELLTPDASTHALAMALASPPPAVDAPVLKSTLFKGDAVLEAVADGHLVLQASGGIVNGIGPVQDALNQLGFVINLGASKQFRGFFGEKTRAALELFQQSTSGILTPTGVVNRETVLALDAALVKSAAPPSPAPPAAAGTVVITTVPKKLADMEEELGGKKKRGVPLFSYTERTAFFYLAAMAIDVDGSSRAYYSKPHGETPDVEPLDSLSSLPSDGSGDTFIQQIPNKDGVVGIGPHRGFFVSGTSLNFGNKVEDECRTDNNVDGEFIPYIVFPPKFKNARPGDMAYVVDTVTFKTTHAIFGDCNDNKRVGEASLAVARNLGRNDLSANNGEEKDRYFYILFPGSRVTPEATAPHWPDDKIKNIADTCFAQWGGLDQVKAALKAI